MQNNWSQDDYIKAYKFSAVAHNGQSLPGTNLPYIVHVSFVAMEVIAVFNIEKKFDENLSVQCALLHDVIEDTETSYEKVKEIFGFKVADGVLALTKSNALAKHLQMEDSLKRIKQQPKEIWIVKLADRITNLQPPPHYWSKEKIVQYREEAVQIYEALRDASDFLSTRLYKKIEDYQTHLK